MIQKFMYYCPWIEMLGLFTLLGTAIALVIYFVPKDNMGEPNESEEGKESNEGDEGEKVEGSSTDKDALRAILDSDGDDASKLANLRALVDSTVTVSKSATDKKDE